MQWSVPSEEQKTGWTKAIDGESVDWFALLGGYRAIVDWPGAAFWPELTAAYPDALVLLSVRDPESWYRSASNTILIGVRDFAAAGDPWVTGLVRCLERTFCGDLEDPDAMMSAFVRHNDAVRAAIPAERLLEWTATEGWEPICERLGLPVPAEPFPVTNSTGDFRAMLGLDPVE